MGTYIILVRSFGLFMSSMFGFVFLSTRLSTIAQICLIHSFPSPDSISSPWRPNNVLWVQCTVCSLDCPFRGNTGTEWWVQILCLLVIDKHDKHDNPSEHLCYTKSRFSEWVIVVSMTCKEWVCFYSGPPMLYSPRCYVHAQSALEELKGQMSISSPARGQVLLWWCEDGSTLDRRDSSRSQ